jgi:uncharacterized coiled-coil DUF342 family protein
MEEIKKIIKDKDNIIFDLNNKVKEQKEEIRNLKYEKKEALLEVAREGNRCKKWEDKYKTAIREYSNVIKKQAELGIELEEKIRQLEREVQNGKSQKKDMDK